MPQSYFIFVVAHSIKGRIRRIHVPYYCIHIVGALAVVGAITVIGFIGSYSRMLMKVAHYNYLRAELDALKRRSSDLQGTSSGQQQQLASLQSLASEVSMTYGIKQVPKGVSPDSQDEPIPTEFRNSVEQYRLLIRAAVATPIQRQNLFQDHWGGVSIPTLWPVEGPITGSFGERLDPFNNEGAFHTGIDISSTFGTPVRATADGG